MSFSLSLGEVAAAYVPYTGGSSDLWPFDGYARAKFYSFEMVDLANNKGRGLSVTFEGVEEDTNGLRVGRRYPLSGVRRDGKSNLQGLLETIQHSYEATGMTQEEAVATVRGLSGNFDTEEDFLAWVSEYIGQPIVIDLKAAALYDKQSGAFKSWLSNVENTVGMDAFNAAQARSDKGRKAQAPEVAANTAPAGGQQQRRGALPGAAAPGGAARPAPSVPGVGAPPAIPGARPTPNGVPPVPGGVPGMASGARRGF